MLNKHSRALKDIFREIGDLTSEFQDRIADGELSDEEDITSRLLERLSKILTRTGSDFTMKSKAVTIKKHKEEPRLGADILVITSYASPTLNFSKGFLAQAKNIDTGKSLSSQQMNSLRLQCSKMVKETVESYVWCYSSRSFRVQKAYVVEKLKTNRPDDVFYTYLRRFIDSFLKCHHGDPNLSFSDFPRLKRIVEEMKIPYVLMITMRSGEDGIPRGGVTPPPDSPVPDLDDLAEQFESVEIEADIRREVSEVRQLMQVNAELPTHSVFDAPQREIPQRIRLTLKE